MNALEKLQDIDTSARTSALVKAKADVLKIDYAPSQVGRLTAEAMTKEYESAAKAIEDLGGELLAIKARLDKEQDKILAAIDEVNALAKRYREEGKRMSATVEDCAKQTQRVRDMVAELTIKT